MVKKLRKPLKKGTVIGEWKDDTGQWWQTIVVKDTQKVFKCTRRKIDKPTSLFQHPPENDYR